MKHSKNDEHATRQKLLVAGIALFCEKGYGGTSVREIVEHAGVTKPALYYYFGNKEGMFRSILDWAAEMQENVLDEVIASSGTVWERVLLLYDYLLKSVEKYHNLFKLIHGLLFGPPQLFPEYDLGIYHRRILKVVKGLFSEGIEKGEVISVEAEEAAYLALAIIDFYLHTGLLHPELANRELPAKLLMLAARGLSSRNYPSCDELHSSH